MIVNKSMFPLQRNFATIGRMQDRMDELQVQLGTGRKVANLADLGSDRMFDLSVRARMSRMEGYKENAGTVSMRLDMLDVAMTRIEKLEGETRGSASPTNFGQDGINLANLPSLSKGRLDELITLLNSDVGGRYLFGGNVTDRAPVAQIGAILDGEGGRAGFRTVVSERKQADAGTDGLGRLDLSRVGAEVTLAEDGTHPFGFKLSALSTTSAAVALTQPAGAPPSLAVEFAANPIAGERVDIGLTMPDGTQAVITLRAVSGAPATGGEFQIGATPADTAANFEAALNAEILDAGSTKLAASSAFAAADNFFNASGQTAMRVDGPPFDTATGLKPATAADTVLWYRGGDTTGSPRATVTAKIDDASAVQYGVQANEQGLVEMMRSLAALAVETYPSADPTAKGRFSAMASMQMERLGEAHNAEAGSVELITLELGLARSAIGDASERHAAYKVQLDTMLANIEQVSIEEVAMEMLALKTRLEASFATTSAVSQLSLVNYLR